MLPFYIKALHLIFIVTWFAGLFYIVRLFIYQVEAAEKPENEKLILQTQFKLMQKRLWYGITLPSAFGTLIFGLWLAELNNLWESGWFHLKLGFVLALFLYHIQCGRIFKQLQNDDIKYSSSKLRIWNEVATLLLVSIIFIATLKNSMDWIWGTVGFFSLAILLILAIKLYKRFRQN